MLSSSSKSSIKKCFNLSHSTVNKQIIKRYFASEQVNVFDRNLKRRQRDWSIQIEESEYYDYLRQESAARLVDRVEDINRSFPYALELGCHRGHVFDLINEKGGLNGTGGIGVMDMDLLIFTAAAPAVV